MEAGKKKMKVLYSPLEWGMGHASRSIWYIHRLVAEGHEVVLAADGGVRVLLRTVFPSLAMVRLPFCRIRYSRYVPAGWKIFISLPCLWRAVRREHRQVRKIVEGQGYDLIISDHRYGVWHPQIPSELVIHQLWFRLPRRLRFLETYLFRLHLRHLRHFDRIVVPDERTAPGYAGLLSHPPVMPEELRKRVEYRGIFSRFLIPAYRREVRVNRIYDVVVVLSGPEPQRSVLEQLLIRRLRKSDWQVLIVRGLPWKRQGATIGSNLRLVSHLPPDRFYTYLKKARYIITRAGYSSVMDLLALGRSALLIPTPGQTEQEYLAEHLSRRGMFVMIRQEEARSAMLEARMEEIKG
jgi:predicted glycosyltransferase